MWQESTVAVRKTKRKILHHYPKKLIKIICYEEKNP